MGNTAAKNQRKSLPVDTSFKLPSPLPTWPQGEGFGNGGIDLGGLRVCEISSLQKVWATHEGGPDNLGASFFDPREIPSGFFMLGCYSQPNNKSLHGCVLAGKDESNSGEILKKPIDYTLIWSSQNLKIKQDGNGFIWLPVAPEGYSPVGLLVTTSSEKPSLDKIRCVQTDFTDQCELDTWIWGQGDEIDPNGFNIFSLRPTIRGPQANGVSVGTFIAQNGNASPVSSVVCLKNVSSNKFSCMPNLNQIQEIFKAYSPWIYFHPDEQYLSSSVDWYFKNGALLYKKGDESNPVPVEPTGSNLPQGGLNDGTYWLDLPVDEKEKERVKKGDIQDTEVYLHVKPILGATFTDIVVWVFLPFNGPGKAKIELIDIPGEIGEINIPLGKIGEHVGDWEHITLRVSNFNGELRKVFLSQHSGGSWFDVSEIEFEKGNKIVSYSSLNGHAMYSKPGLEMQGSNRVGIRNDTAKSKMVLDSGARFSIVAAEHLGSSVVVEPPWLNYLRKWGPNITYDFADEVKKVEEKLPGKLKSAFVKIVGSLPKEVFGEEGPTGPKLKRNWNGDEK